MIESIAQHPVVNPGDPMNLDTHDAVLLVVCRAESRQDQIVTRRKPGGLEGT